MIRQFEDSKKEGHLQDDLSITRIRSMIPGCDRVESSSFGQDKSGCDFWAYSGVQKVGIDVKWRSPGASRFWIKCEPEICIEKWSVIPCQAHPNGKLGWAYNDASLCDYYLFCFADVPLHYLMPALLVRKAAQAEYHKWGREWTQDSGDWQSRSVFVSISRLTVAINRQMVGGLS